MLDKVNNVWLKGLLTVEMSSKDMYESQSTTTVKAIAGILMIGRTEQNAEHTKQGNGSPKHCTTSVEGNRGNFVNRTPEHTKQGNGSPKHCTTTVKSNCGKTVDRTPEHTKRTNRETGLQNTELLLFKSNCGKAVDRTPEHTKQTNRETGLQNTELLLLKAIGEKLLTGRLNTQNRLTGKRVSETLYYYC